MLTTMDIKTKKLEAQTWFKTLRDRICAEFEAIEDAGAQSDAAAGRFERKQWERPTEDGSDGGGGEMSVMRGRVFEKVGVNISTVSGVLSEQFRNEIKGAGGDGQFWASGISLVAHMCSPRVPAVHTNTRMIVTSKQWFGGGADLTPMTPVNEDTETFHAGMRGACDRADESYYPKFKKWCDEYFYLKHRKEPRGVGGIFFDDLGSGDWDADFAFVRDVGSSFLETYATIVRRRMGESWTDAERYHQLERRGRYVEFNLLFDRGTRFGIMTGGNPEAILMSLPPEARWP